VTDGKEHPTPATAGGKSAALVVPAIRIFPEESTAIALAPLVFSPPPNSVQKHELFAKSDEGVPIYVFEIERNVVFCEIASEDFKVGPR